jgi:hypothetical protein
MLTMFRSISRALLTIGLFASAVLLPRAATAAVLGEGWLPGPGASGKDTYSGVIDAPVADARVGVPGAVQLAGWFVDRTAEGWAGADDIEIYLGTLHNGGTLLTHAYFARDRPDVAATFGRADWTQSGWTAVVPTNALLPGQNLLSVYAHSPAKGWWYRQVRIVLDPGATTRTAAAPQGFDISFPQCGGPEPNAPAFAIVGVNGGRAFTGNPCLARQYTWALTATSPTQPRVAFYMNTGNPGPEASTRWPAPGTLRPQPCDGSASAPCAYDYGWSAAVDAYVRARSVAGDAAALSPWWLDVEAANSWSTDTAANAADLQGAIDYLRSVRVGVVGIYALAADWEDIVGASAASDPRNAPFAGLPNWRPGPRSDTEALSWCTRTVTGGRVLFVQYPAGGFDGNLACP